MIIAALLSLTVTSFGMSGTSFSVVVGFGFASACPQQLIHDVQFPTTDSDETQITPLEIGQPTIGRFRTRTTAASSTAVNNSTIEQPIVWYSVNVTDYVINNISDSENGTDNHTVDDINHLIRRVHALVPLSKNE